MKNKRELIWEAKQQGLGDLSLFTSEEIMNELAKHYTVDGATALPQLPAMLARSLKDVKEYERERIIQSFTAEYKLDGCRARLHFCHNGNRIQGRHRSVKTYTYTDHTDNFPQFTAPMLYPNSMMTLGDTILDGEIIAPRPDIDLGKGVITTSLVNATCAIFNSKPERAIALQEANGWCRYIVFDILYWCGEDVRLLSWQKRRQLLTTMMVDLSRGVRGEMVLSETYKPSEELFSQALAKGYEGLMLKDPNSLYSCKEGARPKSWYKWKKLYTVDVFITGYVPGLGEHDGFVGSLCLSVLDKEGEEVEVCRVQPRGDRMRNELSLPGGELKEEYYGRVVEVSYQEKTKERRLRHPVFVRWRDGKSREECTEV